LQSLTLESIVKLKRGTGADQRRRSRTRHLIVGAVEKRSHFLSKKEPSAGPGTVVGWKYSSWLIRSSAAPWHQHSFRLRRGWVKVQHSSSAGSFSGSRWSPEHDAWWIVWTRT